jgi:hypothetical protein
VIVKRELNCTYEKKSQFIVKGRRKTTLAAATRETGLIKTFTVMLGDEIISRGMLNK